MMTDQLSAPVRRLVAYDGSPSARRALRHAADLHRVGDEIGLIHVTEPAEEGDADDPLDEARSALAEQGISSTSIPAAGLAAREICVMAERHGYDTIIIGRRNLRDAGLVLLGSVSARVVAGAHCNVLVVA